MADAIQVFQAIWNPGSSPSNLDFIDTPLGPSIVRRILITWPAGCGGLVGMQVRAGNGFAFPSKQDQFMAFDDYTYPFDVDNQIDSGQWSLYGYNVDLIGHMIQIAYEYDYLRGIGLTGQSQPVSI